MFSRSLSLAFALLTPLAVHAQEPSKCAAHSPIDLVICLDTSGSMEQLIDSARGRIWDIVTELGTAKPTPKLRVGLLTFGTPETSSAEQGFIVRQSDLTDDLDTIYGKMMALTTSGGDEFVGWVLDDAIKFMDWSPDERALRLIYVAGNESADQGADQRNFRYVSEAAKTKDIIINPIYEGPREQGVSELWDQVAVYGGGDFAAIDVDMGTLQMASPFDGDLNALNRELNATYIPFGARGAEGLANQLAQDANAGRMGAQSCGSRVAAKGCGLYNNASWDLVDASQQPEFDWAKLAPTGLPAHLVEKDPVQRKTYVDAMRAVRKAVQDSITTVGAQRKAWLKAETAKRIGGQSLDEAILASLRRQAESKGITFSKVQTVAMKSAAPVEPIEEIAPPKQLSPGASTQLAAFEGRLPAVTYRVSAYEAGQLPFAQILSERIDEPVRIMAGGKQHANEEAARAQLLVVMDEQYQDMLRFQIAAPEAAVPPASGNPAPVGYQVGGLTFGNIKDAKFAHQLVVAAAKQFEIKRQAWLEAHGPLNQPGAQACGTSKTVTVDKYLDEFRTIMMTIARTAAEAFTERGC